MNFELKKTVIWAKHVSPLLFIALFALSSCTEEIDDFELSKSDKRLVVEGGIGIDTCVHTVILSETMDYFSSSTNVPYISGAAVVITEFDEQLIETGKKFVLTENPDRKGHYETAPDVFGKQGYTYRLNISNVSIGGYSEYTADAYFPYIADRIDSIKTVWGGDILFDLLGMRDSNTIWTGWNILLYAKDPPTREYYVFVTYKNGVPLNDTLNRFFVVDDSWIAEIGTYLTGLPIDFISDSAWSAAKSGDTLGLEIRSISEDYFRYINEINTIYGGTNPLFGGAPANVRGNISNGAIGYFHAYGNRKAFAVCNKEITIVTEK